MTHRVCLLTTGGTIAMQAGPQGANLGAAPPFAEMLAKRLPAFEVVVRPLLSKPSAGFSFADIAFIAANAQQAAALGDGVVVTHGTDVLEETAFALELLTRSEAPIVMTGAMRAMGQPSPDGEANLINACIVAASADARGKGILTVFNEEIHWGPLARKRHAFRIHAFSSEPFGPLGWICEGEPRFLLGPIRRLPHLTWDGGTPIIPIVEAGPAMDPSILEKLADSDGLVLALPGVGHIADTTPALLERIASRIPVVFCSRTGGGATLRRSYGYAGGEMDLIQRGLIPGGWLDARKCRIALGILLSTRTSRSEIVKFFAEL